MDLHIFNAHSLLLKGITSPYKWIDYFDKLRPDLIDVVPSYYEILLVFRKELSDMENIKERVVDCLKSEIHNKKTTHLRIPICFDSEFVLDEERVERYSGKKLKDLKKYICSEHFEVAFLGFLPGFPYVQGLPDLYKIPRLDSPRPSVPKGSFALAENQLGLYPSTSPGGWNIIGNCPLPLCNVHSDEITLFLTGDNIQFYEITKKEHEVMQHYPFSRKRYVV